jgi:hypothetical protein
LEAQNIYSLTDGEVSVDDHHLLAILGIVIVVGGPTELRSGRYRHGLESWREQDWDDWRKRVKIPGEY